MFYRSACALLTGIILFINVSAHAHPVQPVRRAEFVMGTMLTITVNGLETNAARNAVASAFKRVRMLDSILSNFNPDSEISRIGYSHESPLRVSLDTFKLLEASAHYSEITNGAFDITAARGVQADFRSVVLNEDCHVYVKDPQLKIDPGAIGKGYAVDQVVALLKENGVRSALVEFGTSSFYALGHNEQDKAWKLLNEKMGAISLTDQALSFSSAETAINPASGTTITESRSAWVIADTAVAADALSTALIVRPALLNKDELHAAWRRACVVHANGDRHCNAK